MIKILQVVVVAFVCFSAQAQVNSGSDGHDGAFNPTANTVINMASHPDGIYHYTSVNIPANVTVTFIPNANNTPVVWLVQGNVIINGVVDVSGSSPTQNAGGSGGPGGYRGGIGGPSNTSGQGPGGGQNGSQNYQYAGNASYGSSGNQSITQQARPGPIYGNQFLLPLLGGSGGGGSFGSLAGGGGGGAILIAASGTVQVSGYIYASGAYGGYAVGPPGMFYGCGSGGAVRIVSSRISGSGLISAKVNQYYGGGLGRVRFDTYQNDFGGSIDGVVSQGFQPIILPASGQGTQLAVTSVGGVPVSASPTGALPTPDAVLSAQQVNPIPIVVRCSNLPLNTPITVSVKPMNGSPVSAMGYNNSGTLASSTATVLVNIPRAGGLIYATATTVK